MNNFGEGSPYGFCSFHPREVVVGICAACLTEKLLVLASKQRHSAALLKKDSHQCGSCAFSRAPSCRKPSVAVPRVFALGSSLLHRLESRHRRPGYDSDEGSVLSLDDSFISIKFEDNGQFSWDKKAANNLKPGGGKALRQFVIPPGQDQPTKSAAATAGRTVVEHARPRGAGIRWRKRIIGQLFQLVRWRRPSKGGGSCRAGFSGKVVDGGERRGWIRSLTRRKTTE